MNFEEERAKIDKQFKFTNRLLKVGIALAILGNLIWICLMCYTFYHRH